MREFYIFVQQAVRQQNQGKDMEEMSSIMRLIGSPNNMFGANTFNEMAAGFKDVAVLSEKSAIHQHNAINERFHLLIDVLTAHR